MTTENSCGGGSASSTLIFACSGSSNVGQVSHSMALKAMQDGIGKMSCLAGIGAHISSFLDSARQSKQLVVIDGCEQKCALNAFEHVGIQPHLYLDLTENDFEKRPGVASTEEEVSRACTLLKNRLRVLVC